METVTLTDFRANLYGMVNQMLRTGEPLLLRRENQIIELRGKVRKNPQEKSKVKRDLSKIIPMDCMVKDPDWYISPKLSEWSGDIDPDLR